MASDCKIKKIAKIQKQKYLNKDTEYILGYLKTIEKEILETYRLLGENNYTDDEIADRVSKITVPEKNISLMEAQYDPANMSNHSSCDCLNFDVREFCQDMTGIDYEIFKLFAFDDNRKYLGCLQGTCNEMYISKEVFNNIKNSLYEKYPECRYVVSVHNHPHYICANTDKEDDDTIEKLKIELSEKGMILANDYILTDYDCFSRNSNSNR
ncbi:MAG: hypothetical protein IJI66_10600 [Erysipelotrichaceae bacterium]|nr:hypothetical protein [Erysipelotrichaceae bacterium]